jgi:signal transduction histidine kinase
MTEKTATPDAADRVAKPAWLWDSACRRIAWANDAGLVFWGAASLLDIVEYIFAADSDVVRAIQTSAVSNAAIDAELTPQTRRLAVRMRAKPMKLFDGRDGILVVVMQAQEKARPALGRALFDAVPVALVRLDTSGGALDANELGRSLMPMLSRTLLAQIAAQAIEQGAANRTATVARDGREVSLLLHAARFLDPRDGTPSAILRVEDVSARHAIEQRLRAKVPPQQAEAHLRDQRDDAEARNRAKSDFVAKVTHEMRNPLNAIIGFSEIMQQKHFGPLGDRRYEGYVDDVLFSARHLLSLVNDLLDLAAIEAGKFRIAFDSVALAGVIDDCARLLKPQAADLGIELKTAVPANLPPVSADARALRQVMLNLMSNAIKFTPKGGEVFVSAGQDGDGGIVIGVRDTGVGMTPNEIQLALEPFGQVDGALQRDRKGTGLGLPLAKALAEANKAQFRISSEPDRGTIAELVFAPSRVLAG